VFVVPFGVVAVTFLAVCLGPFVMSQFPEMDVAVDELTVQVTPVPDTVIAVAPWRSEPARVTGMLVL
jgi:hypothetical protein